MSYLSSCKRHEKTKMNGSYRQVFRVWYILFLCAVELPSLSKTSMIHTAALCDTSLHYHGRSHCSAFWVNPTWMPWMPTSANKFTAGKSPQNKRLIYSVWETFSCFERDFLIMKVCIFSGKQRALGWLPLVFVLVFSWDLLSKEVNYNMFI